MTMVVYDFMDRDKIPPGAVDGSDQMLRPEDRVTDADRKGAAYGLLRRVQDARRAREKAAQQR